MNMGVHVNISIRNSGSKIERFELKLFNKLLRYQVRVYRESDYAWIFWLNIFEWSRNLKISPINFISNEPRKSSAITNESPLTWSTTFSDVNVMPFDCRLHFFVRGNCSFYVPVRWISMQNVIFWRWSCERDPVTLCKWTWDFSTSINNLFHFETCKKLKFFLSRHPQAHQWASFLVFSLL